MDLTDEQRKRVKKLTKDVATLSNILEGSRYPITSVRVKQPAWKAFIAEHAELLGILFWVIFIYWLFT